jgi:hypothetical protein
MVEAQERQDYQGALGLVSDFLAKYPGLAGWQPIGPAEMPIFIYYPGTELRNVALKLPKPSPGTATAQLIASRTTARYRSRNLLYPAVDSSGLPVHPLMIWWAVLFTLSRLARYQPREWDLLINIARHPCAAAIEYLLQEALLALPELSLDSLERVVQLEPPSFAGT